MNYKIEITETLQKTVEVEADSEHEAITKVKEQYYGGQIVLYPECHIDTEIELLN